MDFSYTEEQHALRELMHRLCTGRADKETAARTPRDGAPYDRELWAALAQAGILGTAIASAYGGAGLGMIELGLLLEEQGRTLAPLPLLPALVLAALPLGRFGNSTQRQLLSELASGNVLLTAALEEEGREPMAPQAEAHPVPNGWRLSGEKTCVPYALESAYLLVSARTATHGAALFLVPAAAPGVRLELQRSSCGQPQGRLTLAGVTLGASELLGTGPAECAAALGWTIARGHVALAAQQLGVVEEALRRAAAYVSERRQFGRPIGTFQAVQHRLADCYIDVEALRSAYLRAAWALDCGGAAAAEVLAAKWWAAEAGHRVTHAVQHVHGGIGADLQYPVHAYFLAAKQLELSLGGAAPVLAALGSELARGVVPAFTAAE